MTGFSLSIKPLLPLVIDRRQIGRSSKDTLSLDRPGFGGITHRGNLDWTSLLGIGDGEDQVDLAISIGLAIDLDDPRLRGIAAWSRGIGSRRWGK